MIFTKEMTEICAYVQNSYERTIFKWGNLTNLTKVKKTTDFRRKNEKNS